MSSERPRGLNARGCLGDTFHFCFDYTGERIVLKVGNSLASIALPRAARTSGVNVTSFVGSATCLERAEAHYASVRGFRQRIKYAILSQLATAPGSKWNTLQMPASAYCVDCL
jgi:hypothetical protein